MYAYKNIIAISSFNGQLSLDILKREAIIVCLIQYFEADFLLNSGMIPYILAHQ